MLNVVVAFAGLIGIAFALWAVVAVLHEHRPILLRVFSLAVLGVAMLFLAGIAGEHLRRVMLRRRRKGR